VTVAISPQRRQCSRFSRCVGVAETNPRNCFSRCADDESLNSMRHRNICCANRARTNFSYDWKFPPTKNLDGERVDAAAISNSFAGA
jgi:hypothetical protein